MQFLPDILLRYVKYVCESKLVYSLSDVLVSKPAYSNFQKSSIDRFKVHLLHTNSIINVSHKKKLIYNDVKNEKNIILTKRSFKVGLFQNFFAFLEWLKLIFFFTNFFGYLNEVHNNQIFQYLCSFHVRWAFDPMSVYCT